MGTRPSHHRWSLLTITAAGCLGFGGLVVAQQFQQAPLARPAETPAPPPNVSTDPLLRGFEFRSIGPAAMMGRVDDIAGSEKDPMIIYVGFATGGLWKSTDGGNHWKSQFDNMPNESIGAIGIAPSDPNVVYVGTGEANNRQSSSIGDGVWGTTDGGKTWNHLGLEDTQSIGRIVVDPTNPNIVYVAAIGHLFGPNPERGLLQDRPTAARPGRRSKYIDPDTGFTDVAIDPSNPKILYAASFAAAAHLVGLQRRRTGQRAVEDHRRRRDLDASSKARAGRSRRTASTAASRFRFSAPSPPRFTRRWKPARAPAPAAAPARMAWRQRGGRGGGAAASRRRNPAAPTPPAAARRSRRQQVPAGGGRRRWWTRRTRRAPAASRPQRPAASSAPTTAARPGRS